MKTHIKRPCKRWTDDEIDLLREKYPRLGARIPRLLECHSLKAVGDMAYKLQLEINLWRTEVRLPISVARIAYFAGLIDGEGTMGIYHYRSNTEKTIILSIANTNLDVMTWIVRTFGVGTLCARKTIEKHHKQRYDWYVRRRGDVLVLLRLVLPYLIIKKGKAEELIAECERWRENNG